MDAAINPDALVEKVTQLQKSRGYTDQQMADAFGCNRRTYQQTRTGKMKVGNAYFSGAMKFLSLYEPERRSSAIERKTKETDISLELDIDGTGKLDISTGIYMLDHFLSQVAKHGRFDLKLSATGDDPHHLADPDRPTRLRPRRPVHPVLRSIHMPKSFWTRFSYFALDFT